MEEREDEGRRAGEGEGAWLQLAARGGGVTWVCRTRSERRRRESTRRASGRRLLRRRGKRSELSHLALEEGEALGDFGHQLVVVHRLRLPMRSGGGRRGGVGAGRGGLGNSLRAAGGGDGGGRERVGRAGAGRREGGREREEEEEGGPRSEGRSWHGRPRAARGRVRSSARQHGVHRPCGLRSGERAPAGGDGSCSLNGGGRQMCVRVAAAARVPAPAALPELSPE